MGCASSSPAATLYKAEQEIGNADRAVEEAEKRLKEAKERAAAARQHAADLRSSRRSTRSYYTHHAQRISLAAVISDARNIIDQVNKLKQDVCRSQ